MNKDSKLLSIDQKDFLKQSNISTFSVATPKNIPHSTPVLAVEFNDRLYFACHISSRKVSYVRSNPHVCLTTVSRNWYPYLSIQGTASIRTRNDLDSFESILERIFNKHKDDENKQKVIDRITGNEKYVLMEIQPKHLVGSV